MVRATRRPYRGGLLELIDLRQTSAKPRTLFEATAGAQVYLKGWTRRGTIVALRSFRPDVRNVTEIWEITPRGDARLIATERGFVGMTARLDPVRDLLFATSVEHDLSTVRAVSLATGGSKTVVANAVDGITFGGYAVTPDGWLLHMRKQTNHDVWVFSLGDLQTAPTPQGAKR